MPRTRLPAAIWVLGLVSMLMDISSEMVHALLPLFLVDTLGASVLAVGVLEGLAESTALIAKVFSGALSDRLGSRKGLTVGGYALSAVTKPLFALASGSGMVLAARLVDRVGKGVRGAPRDALVADLAPPGARGAAFGLRQSLDTTGAFLGPLVAVVLMLHWRGDFRAIFWVSVVPAALAVALLVIGVREPAREHAPGSPPPVRLAALARLPARYWGVVGVGAVFTLARFSEAFLVLRAQHAGVRAALIPLVMVLMNVTYAATAYPAGRLADRLSRRTLLAWGLLALVGADLILAGAIDWMAMLPGVVLWGVHMGLTQGLFAAMVADAAPADLRGTAFGVFNLASGVSLLLASVIAGALWARWGAPATFLTGAAFATLALAGVMGARTS
ncbi:MFS transporter [Luteitalea sp. TBR-22]|uniref:MFS transporter n=1 Tax=Luteitalea sp. TBR-22 TaxID=2802971 RepID=UPI001EF4DF49|nr:MFS transporter [Luteitalea sp. TBR-22]